jgi:serine phosphatase RsbU (regulator of sigma subunit)
VGAFQLRALSLPLWSVVIAIAMLGVAGAVLRGDRMRRVGVLVLVASALPWSVCMALAASTDDPALATSIYRAGIGTISVAGPSLLFIVLSDAGKLEQHRTLVIVAIVCALSSMIACWSTDLVITGVRPVAGGLLYPTAGPINGMHIGQIALWAGTGIVLARRGQRHSRDESRRLLMRTSLVIAGLAVIGTSDALVSEGVWDIYPMAWLPAASAGLLGVWVLWRTNRLRGEGFDRRGAVELVLTLAAAVAVIAIVYAARGSAAARPLTIAALTAPLAALAFLIGMPGRQGARTRRLASVSGDAMVGFAEQLGAASTDDDIAQGIVTFLGERAGASMVRLWRMTPEGLVPLTDDSPVPPLDARVRAWLVANRAPIVAADAPSMRLGGMRALVEGFVVAADADVIVPLIDRDAMVGLVTVTFPDGRAPRPPEREVIAEASQATAQALTFTQLRREAEARAQTAREVEVADAMQAARADGDVRTDVGTWRVMACYRPGGKVAGDVWTWSELGGGELLLVVGDVIGRGLSAALIAAAVSGAVESAAALRGGALDPKDLLELLHDTVTSVSGPVPTLGAFAAVLSNGRVRFAAAGHRGAYRVRANGGAEADVTALVASGTPLGDKRLHIGRAETDLAAGDLIVIASDGVVDVTDKQGQRWGERRLVRALRTWVPKAGDGAAEQLVSAASVHAGDTSLDDDLVVLAARAR